MSSTTPTEYFDDIFSPFYEEIDHSSQRLTEGQLCWAPVFFRQSIIKVWRPDHLEHDEWGFATADYFSVRTNPPDLFNHDIPIKYPEERKSTEEFLFAKAKLRPVIVLFQSSFSDNIQQIRHGHKLQHDVVVALPLYSIFDKETNNPKFHRDTVQKTRLLAYSNLFFMPEHKIFGLRDSIVRLDYVFSIYPELIQFIPLKLANDPFIVLKQSFEALVNQGIREGSELEQYKSIFNEFLN